MDHNQNTKGDAGQGNDNVASDNRAAYTTGQVTGYQAHSYPPVDATNGNSNGNGNGTNDKSQPCASARAHRPPANANDTANTDSGGPYAMVRWLRETAYEEPWNETHLRSTMNGSSCRYGHGYGCDGGSYIHGEGAGASGSGQTGHLGSLTSSDTWML